MIENSYEFTQAGPEEYYMSGDPFAIGADYGFRTSDVLTSSGVNYLLLIGWGIICLLGLAVMFLVKQPIAGAVLMIIPTLIGMVLKPTFALCLFLMILPTGTAIAIEGVFTLNKGIGLALALTFFLNILFTRPSLHIDKKALWLGVGYSIWVIFSILMSPFAELKVQQIFTRIQLTGLFLITYWILSTNVEKSLVWVLRSFVFGTVATIVLSFVTGAAARALEETAQGRFTATVGGGINANLLAAFVALAFLSTIYLYGIDRSIWLRVCYIVAVFFQVVMLFKMGSRGTLFAIIISFVISFGGRQAIRNPRLVLIMILLLGIFLGTGYFLIHTGRLHEEVAERITNVEYIKNSILLRLEINKEALRVGLRHFMGTGIVGWFVYTQDVHLPHNDLMFSVGVYGFPAGILFVLMIIASALVVKKMPLGLEKMYAKLLLTFLIVIGLKGMYIGEKFYWAFFALLLACERISRMKLWYRTALYNELESGDPYYESFGDQP